MKPKILLSNSGSGQRRARRSSTGPWADTDPSVNSNTTDFGSADLTNADDDPIPAPAAFQPNDAAPALAPPALAVKRAGLDADAMSDHSPLFDIPNELLAARDAEPVPAMAQQRVMDAEAFERSVRRLCAHSEEAAPEEGGVLEDGRGLDRLAPPDKPPPDSAYPDWVWFFRDVAERRKVEDALRASEARFRTLVEEAPDAILLIDFDRSRVVGVNKAAERLFGASRDEILERGPQRFYTPEQPDGRPAAQSYSEYGKRALTGEEVTFERRIRRTSGEERLCRVTFVRLPSNVPLLRASLVDITSQSRAQRELASTAAILAAEHESSPDGVLVVDPTARIISINRRFGEIFDVPAALLASRDDAALLAMVSKKVRDADRFLRRVRDLCAQPDQSARDEMVLKDGRVIDRLTSPFKSAGGEYLGRIWFFRDISEGRKAEELLRSSKARFRTLVEEAPDAILLLRCRPGPLDHRE